jgi:hypothetical protein
VRILVRPRAPVLALLLLAPSIPELLTGSTPFSLLFQNPLQFAVQFGFDMGLYGTGALLIREISVLLRKGWATVLLWGAAYGIAEEGFAVHTFFERSGPPVGALTSYGSAYGVNWLWALGLTVFHATYSIALPILVTYLAFPQARAARWLDRGNLGLMAVVYLAVVGVFAFTVGHGPAPAAAALFLVITAVLLGAGAKVPQGLPGRRAGPRTLGRWSLGFLGSVEWLAWVSVLVASGSHRVPAAVAAAGLVLADGGAFWAIVRNAGTADLDRSMWAVAAGMLIPLFVWDGLLETTVPGILILAAISGYLLYWLGRSVDLRASPAAESSPRSSGLA